MRYDARRDKVYDPHAPHALAYSARDEPAWLQRVLTRLRASKGGYFGRFDHILFRRSGGPVPLVEHRRLFKPRQVVYRGHRGSAAASAARGGSSLRCRTGGPLSEFAAQIDHALLRDFYGYWLSKRGGKRVPARADIDPVEIRRFLPNIFMLDVIDGGARFRYRLVGTAIGDAIGDYTGRYVDEALPPAEYAIYREKYVPIIRDFAIHYEVARAVWRERADVLYRRLMLPLSNDQAAANILLGVSHFDYGGRPLRDGQRIGDVTRIERIAEHTILAPPPAG